MKRRSFTGFSVALALLVGTIVAVAAPAVPAQAAVASQFDPGLIISDAKFFDGGAMNASDVQNFLNTHSSGCQAGYTCLKSYHQVTASKAAQPGKCAAYPGGGDESSAVIITKVGQVCGISQAVLIVLLQKEQGLVTSTAPSAGAYRAATGYGCPDTAACDANYYGFFNQVYMAALQFKRYAASPTGWNHIAGRVNSIAYSPNPACGASNVLIQNQATAGLYNYTPYQPNAAALNNLYGSGDGCSSYGNRNFWVYYTDWFGPTTTSSLLRTPDDPQVWLVSGSTKFKVPDLGIMAAFAPLGPVNYVSQSYLGGLTTGSAIAGHIIRGPDGAIYFIDAGIKTQFTSCAEVVDYGGSCDSTGYVQLTALQIGAYYTGPYATPVLATVEGSRFYLDNGTKREILDDASQAAAGLAPGYNVLTEAGLANLPYGPPLTRDGVYAGVRGSSDAVYLDQSKAFAVPSGSSAEVGATSRLAGSLHTESLSFVPKAGTPYSGVVTDGTSTYVLSAGGRYGIDPAFVPATPPVPIASALLATYPLLGTVTPGSAIKGAGSALVSLFDGQKLRPVTSWDALVRLTGTATPAIQTLPDGVVAGMPTSNGLLSPGVMYRTQADPQIYLIDGTATKIPVASFDDTTALGATTWTYASDALLAGYATAAQPLGSAVTCNGRNYVASAGTLRPLDASTQTLYPVPFTALAATTCAGLQIGAPAIDFIRTPDGAIYQLFGGQKHHVGAATFSALNAGKGWMDVTSRFAALITSGSNV